MNFKEVRIFRSPDATDGAAYGYEEDKDGAGVTFSFGLNAGNVFLKKFEWVANGGKDGAEQEACEIIFDVNGTEKSYRQFPVTKAYLKGNKGETTDPSTPEFKEAVSELNARFAHIMHCFLPDEVYKQKLTEAKTKGQIKSFKTFVGVLKSMLSAEVTKVELDLFMQYQYALGETKKQTYLEIPTKRKHGAFLCKHVPGKWKMVKLEDPEDNVVKALYYVDEDSAIKDAEGNITGYSKTHPFIRTGWFVNSNFAHLQKNSNFQSDSNESNGADDEGAAAMNQQSDVADTNQPSSW